MTGIGAPGTQPGMRAAVGARQRDRRIGAGRGAGALQRLEADERDDDDERESEHAEQRPLRGLHDVDDVGLRLLDRRDDDRRERNADDRDDVAARAVGADGAAHHRLDLRELRRRARRRRGLRRRRRPGRRRAPRPSDA